MEVDPTSDPAIPYLTKSRIPKERVTKTVVDCYKIT